MANKQTNKKARQEANRKNRSVDRKYLEATGVIHYIQKSSDDRDFCIKDVVKCTSIDDCYGETCNGHIYCKELVIPKDLSIDCCGDHGSVVVPATVVSCNKHTNIHDREAGFYSWFKHFFDGHCIVRLFSELAIHLLLN